jgi:hypothetical protein
MKHTRLFLAITLVLILIIFAISIYIYLYRKSNEGFVQNQKIYAIITVCLLEEDFEKRKEQYITGISSLMNYIRLNQFNHPIIPIIVENNSTSESTFLNDFDIPVLYTHSNNKELCKMNRTHIGEFEMNDVHAVIKKYNIHDDDFIVKFTGRYIISPESEFMRVLASGNYDAIIKFGHFSSPLTHKDGDCITGLIGMRAKYVKQLRFTGRSIEHEWATMGSSIPDAQIYIPKKLGVYIWPGLGATEYFLV